MKLPPRDPDVSIRESKRLRFVVSLLAFRPGRIGGTEQFLRSLLSELPSVLGKDELVIVAGREAADSIATPGLDRLVLDLGDASIVGRRVAEAFTPWRDRRLEEAILGLQPDAILFPQISMFPKATAIPAVVMVGDLQHLVLPHHIPLVHRAFRRAIYPRSLSRARVVVAVSDRTRDDVVERAGVDAGKVRVVRAGCMPMRGAGTTGPPPVAGDYLYYPAVSHPHKGHEELFDSFAMLADSHGSLRLVLTGQRTPHWRRLSARVHALGLHERVVHLGHVAPEVVESLYAHAAAVVFPSRFEGFGLPVVEAASHGARVIASALSVFDENDTEGVQRIDFRDVEQLRAALASDGRARVVEGAWSWRDAASGIVEALREAARDPSGDGTFG